MRYNRVQSLCILDVSCINIVTVHFVCPAQIKHFMQMPRSISSGPFAPKVGAPQASTQTHTRTRHICICIGVFVANAHSIGIGQTVGGQTSPTPTPPSPPTSTPTSASASTLHTMRYHVRFDSEFSDSFAEL